MRGTANSVRSVPHLPYRPHTQQLGYEPWGLGTAQPLLPGSGAQEDLLHWCQQQTAGYPGVHVTNLSSSWADGLALCALVNRLRPGLL